MKKCAGSSIVLLEEMSKGNSKMQFFFSRKLVLIMGFLLFSSSFINAQSFNLHLDKTFYIAGESIHYCIYPATTLKTDSMLIYVEMHSYSGQMKMQQIHRLQSKSVAGSISLPVSWNEGNYLFVCYAIWDDVLGDTSVVRSYQEIIPVYNDLELKPSDEGIDSIRYSTEIAPMNQVTSFPTKSKASLSLNVYNSDLPTQNGEYSVSIHQATIGENKQLSESNTVAAVPDPLRYSVRKQLVLSGKVSDPYTHKVIDDKNLSLYIPSIKVFKRIPAVKGLIKSIIPDVQSGAFIQVLSLNPNTRYPLVLEQYISMMPSSNLASLPKLSRSPSIQKMLRQYAKARLINDIFEKKSNPEPLKADTTIEFTPDKRFKLSDFQELTTLEEFIKEVLLDAHITTIINKKKSLRLRNKDANQLYRWPAWYMLDNVFQSDEDAMLNFNISKIKSIDLYQKNQSIESQFDPIMRYNGIFSINTYLQDEIPRLIYSVQGLTPESELLIDRNIPSPTIPDLRTMILWQTNMKPDASGKINLQFQSSDIKGKYRIELKGINEDGHVIHQQVDILVD